MGCGSSLLYGSMLCNGPAEAALAAPGSNTCHQITSCGWHLSCLAAPMQLELRSRVVKYSRDAVHGVHLGWWFDQRVCATQALSDLLGRNLNAADQAFVEPHTCVSRCQSSRQKPLKISSFALQVGMVSAFKS